MTYLQMLQPLAVYSTFKFTRSLGRTERADRAEDFDVLSNQARFWKLAIDVERLYGARVMLLFNKCFKIPVRSLSFPSSHSHPHLVQMFWLQSITYNVVTPVAALQIRS